MGFKIPTSQKKKQNIYFLDLKTHLKLNDETLNPKKIQKHENQPDKKRRIDYVMCYRVSVNDPQKQRLGR